MDKAFSGKYNFLSNFYPCTIEYEGIIYPSVEHAYQAAKTTNVEIRKSIAEVKDSSLARQAGKGIILRDNWENLRLVVMEELLHQKFSNTELKQKLLLTGDAYLEEVNWWGDRFWGVCKGTGSNHLGRLLMEIREEYTNEA